MTSNKNIEKLTSNIWITRGARFNAYRRLARKNHASIFAVSILSFYNVGIALFPSIVGTEIVPPATIAVSIFILIISLLEAGKGYAVKAERMHQNAVDLNYLLNRINITEKIDREKTESFYNEYYKLIKNCPENHAPCDDKLFRTEHSHDFNLEYCIKITRPFVRPLETAIWKVKKPQYYYFKLLYFLETYWLYTVLTVIPIVSVILFHAGFFVLEK